MNRDDLVLAALAAGDNTEYEPVQVQKLFFLIDENVSNRLGGPFFKFRPDAYGPFDGAVYDALRELSLSGFVQIWSRPALRYSTYRLTNSGLARGRGILSGLHPDIQRYLTDLSSWVRSLAFDQLVTAIYAKYPLMKVNSIFRG